MKTSQTLKTRREFLRTAALGGALSWTVPTFLANTFAALHAEAAGAGRQAVTGRDSTILVVLQMAGGNDGLNTVVPYTNDHYYRARPHLGIAAQDVLRLSDAVGLHPELAAFRALHDAGQLGVVQGVGYPNPNRSHFRSTEIWQTASDARQIESEGWLGRYFDNTCAGCDPVIGVSIGRQMPLAFAGKSSRGVCFDNPDHYRFLSGARLRPGERDAAEESFRKLNQAEDPTEGISGGSIAAISGAPRQAGSPLDFIERTALDAQISSDEVRSLVRRVDNQTTYPASPLGNSLKLVSRLIGGGLATRVFYVSQGGYDTHANQAATQARLLKELGDSVKAFVEDLKAQGNLERVLVMTFSEFGRRVSENANHGTDHGAAAPLFLIGSRLKAGLLGRYPSLAPGDLFQGDLKYEVDFRCVYAAVLENWLNTKSAPILGRKFEPLAIA